MFLCTEVRIPTLQEWDPEYESNKASIFREAKAALRCRPSPKLASHDPRNRSIVGWCMHPQLPRYAFPRWCKFARHRVGGLCIHALHIVLFPLYYLCVVPAVCVTTLVRPIVHICFTSGTYLVCRELVALPLRRRLLSSFTVPVTARTGAGFWNQCKLLLDIPLCYFDGDIGGKSDASQQVHTMRIEDTESIEKKVSIDWWCESGQTIDLMMQRGLAHQVFCADSLEVERKRIAFDFYRCSLSLLLGVSRMVVGAAIFVIVFLQPLTYALSLCFLNESTNPNTVQYETIEAYYGPWLTDYLMRQEVVIRGTTILSWWKIIAVQGLNIQFHVVCFVLMKICDNRTDGKVVRYDPPFKNEASTGASTYSSPNHNGDSQSISNSSE